MSGIAPWSRMQSEQRELGQPPTLVGGESAAKQGARLSPTDVAAFAFYRAAKMRRAFSPGPGRDRSTYIVTNSLGATRGTLYSHSNQEIRRFCLLIGDLTGFGDRLCFHPMRSLLCLFFLASTHVGLGQAPGVSPVEFNVVVKSAGAASDLKPEYLRVTIDGQEQPITGIIPVKDLRRRLALVVDASSSVRDGRRATNSILSAAIDYLNQRHRPDRDLMSVYAFDSVVATLQNETNSLPAVVLSLKRIRVGGGTSLFNGVAVASMKVGDAMDAAGILFVVSDGDDNQSQITREEAIAIARERNVMVFTFNNTTTSPSNFTQGSAILRKLAEETGGTYCEEYKSEKIARCFERLEDQIESTYRIRLGGFTLMPDAKRHKLKVQSAIPALKISAPDDLYAGGKKKK
jgi:Ca-activated chloride channel homolog